VYPNDAREARRVAMTLVDDLPPLHPSELEIQRARSAKLFGECSCGVLLECGFCPACQPAEHARSLQLAREAERADIEKRQREFQEQNKPNAEMAALLETRRDAQHYRGLCKALRDGTASYLQIKLARRLTQPRALKRATRKR
jgi:hypothetical protein